MTAGQTASVPIAMERARSAVRDVPAATAILDRFFAHAEIIQLPGKSYRLHQRVRRSDAAATEASAS